jgi:hypothetical protein
MLLIRQEQLESFRSQIINKFASEMSFRLFLLFPTQTASMEQPELEKQIKYCISKAVSYGITLEGDAQRYLEHAVLHGWDFDSRPETPWVGEILRDPHLDGEAKMDRIELIAQF